MSKLEQHTDLNWYRPRVSAANTDVPSTVTAWSFTTL